MNRISNKWINLLPDQPTFGNPQVILIIQKTTTIYEEDLFQQCDFWTLKHHHHLLSVLQIQVTEMVLVYKFNFISRLFIDMKIPPTFVGVINTPQNS